jgi:hypothetical protein
VSGNVGRGPDSRGVQNPLAQPIWPGGGGAQNAAAQPI